MVDGIQGLLDFVGYPVSDPQNVGAPQVPVGFYGLLDFTGIPYGDPNNVPTTGKANGVGGRHLVRYILAQQEHQSLLDHARRNAQQEALSLFQARVEGQWLEYQRELARQRDNTIFAALLAEV